MTAEIIQGIVRHLMTAAGGVLVANGVATDAQWQDAVGACVALVGVVWSIMHKTRAT